MMQYQHFVHLMRIQQLMQTMLRIQSSMQFGMIEVILLNYHPIHQYMMQFVQTTRSLMQFVMSEQMNPYQL
jgi:hypothetical protein